MKKEDLKEIKHLFRPMNTGDVVEGNIIYFIEDHVADDIIIKELMIDKIANLGVVDGRLMTIHCVDGTNIYNLNGYYVATSNTSIYDFPDLIEDNIYEFKVRDYTTHIVGRYTTKAGHYNRCFVVERGDGTKWFYELYRVEWYLALIPGSPKREIMKYENM